MRIIFMGTPDFAVPVLAALAEAGHELAAAVTQPDKPKGRGREVRYTPVKQKALALGIPVYQPARVKEPEFLAELSRLSPDVIVVAAFGQILPEAILRLPPYGCVNVHASLLPKYRGAAPIQWAVINGETKTGITIMQMDKGLDTGDMLAKREIGIAPDETGGSLHDKLSVLGGPLLLEVLRDLEAGRCEAVPQTGESSYASQLKKEMGRIDWRRPAAEIERRIRGLSPWPGTYTCLDGRTWKIWAAEVCAVKSARPDNTESGAVPCGGIFAVEKDRFLVQTGEGILAVKELQPEGKKRMTAEAFLRGYSLERGMLLGEKG
ncbi:MAG: methionyl-tRNA formyltransferase [Lachnospiraceae bacterium]|nr:methionyl-tRNA formyltransferase [Lachnospiraceae bacterium]